MKNSIPVGQFLRLKRICSGDVDCNKEAIEMASRFEERGYPKSAICRAFKIAEKVP